MLDRLDEVPWSSLDHAYGPADDVPGQLRALRSPDADERGRAVSALYGNVFHQGTRFPASAHAVPFLLELVAAPDTPDREVLLGLLTAIAIGYDESHLPGTVPIAEYRRAAAGGAALLPDADFFEHRESLPEDDQDRLFAHVTVAAYDAVKAGVPLFRTLLADPDPGVRCQAAYALAWFPEEAEGSVAALTGPLDPDEIAAATAVVATGLLGGTPVADDRRLVRWGRAIATRDVPELLRWAGSADQGDDRIPFLGGDLAGLAASALPERAEVLDALLARVPHVSGVEALPVVGEALRRTEDDPDGRRRLLEVLAATPAVWLLGGRRFGNFVTLLAGHGVPHDIEALREYLG
ncbi:hypothetical protein GCM10022243_34900 [Saccharothrix violaceirubra]|uniref:HEAT repeat protein n=1 Tax=Saccharothrix violaceirubra TaxID=413306 RepID=A0A7W7WX02_9PSEU|nr:hypothetical protein [Saccharothrix violaceirubra]MBB4966542.1 hypothetical protein [Saccharothrix violaceirubra]